MKTKTTEIQYCEDCPHRKYDRYIEMYCKKTNRKVGVIAIPDWCPLPDSSAPELLEALEYYVAKFGNCGKAYDQAQAAINKARGQED